MSNVTDTWKRGDAAPKLQKMAGRLEWRWVTAGEKQLKMQQLGAEDLVVDVETHV